MKIKRILVPVDFSEPSLRALDYAAELARALRSSIEVLCVVEPLVYAPLAGPAIDLGAVRAEQERIAGARLSTLRRELVRKRLRCRTDLRTGVPYRIIVDRAAKLPADLIVMGTLGRGGLSHLLLGSVAERGTRSATCPVLTVRGGAKSRRSSTKPR